MSDSDSYTTYKQSKESFVSGLTGSTISHVNLVSSAALASIALHATLQSRFPFWRSISLPLSWTIFVLPLLLSMTLFADVPTRLATLLTAPSLLVLNWFPAKEQGFPLPSSQPNTPIGPSTPRTFSIMPLPSLTIYRSHMMLMTILAILAVDFPVFPRYLAKCETYGVSLMDVGVGSFVFSQGIVSAIPILTNPRHLRAPLFYKLQKVVKKSLPIILLGVIRAVLVKGTDYPVHATEYGVHWNFFITLALVPVLQVLLDPLMTYFSVIFLAVSVAVGHQLALSYLGLERYVLYAPRTDFLSANKEGIVSLLGYLSIHLLGLSLGTIILPSTPSYFRRMQRQLKKQEGLEELTQSLRESRRLDKIRTELLAYVMLWWFALFAVKRLNLDGGAGVSRRMVNLSYIVWIAAYNTSFILGYIAVDAFVAPPAPKEKSMDHPLPAPPPSLLDAVNKNSLALFLVANVATGLINLSIPTMYTEDSWAMAILCFYSFGLCALAWAWKGRKIISL